MILKIKKIVILSFLILSAFTIQAQSDFRPGYVITLSGDTIFGQIDYRGDLTMGRICRFEFPDKTRKEYTPYDIQTYRFTDSKYYVSREIDGLRHFLEFLVKGEIDFYYLRDQDGDHYYAEKQNEPLSELPYKEKIREGEYGKKYLERSRIHTGLLYLYSDDAPQLKEDINKIEKPNHRGLMQFAKKYHQAVCTDGSECVIFERSVPLFKIKAEAMAGGYLFFNNAQKFIPIKNTYIAGANLYIWLPRVNENFYFKTGFSYSPILANLKTNEYSEFVFENVVIPNTPKRSISKYRIPLQIEYVYPKGMFRPTLSVGVNLYRFNNFGFHFLSAYSVGLLYKPDNTNFSISSRYELEIASFMPVIPVSDFSPIGNSLSLGVGYTF